MFIIELEGPPRPWRAHTDHMMSQGVFAALFFLVKAASVFIPLCRLRPKVTSLAYSRATAPLSLISSFCMLKDSHFSVLLEYNSERLKTRSEPVSDPHISSPHWTTVSPRSDGLVILLRNLES